jgi:hypothetical protein
MFSVAGEASFSDFEGTGVSELKLAESVLALALFSGSLASLSLSYPSREGMSSKFKLKLLLAEVSLS